MASAYETYLRRYLNDNGALWSSAQIERWALRAEQQLCEITPSVVERMSLPIETDVPLYEIPRESLGIAQITYRGKLLVPLSQEQARDAFPDYVISDYLAATGGGFEPTAFEPTAFATPTASGYATVAGTASTPQFWAFSGYDENTIQLFPTPAEDLVSTASARLWDTEIPNRCIVEYRTFQGNTNDTKPLYRLVRMLIKDYVLASAFGVEGKGQQLDVSEYLMKRFKSRLELYKQIARGVFVANKNQFSEQTLGMGRFPRRPNFGNDIGRRVR